MSCSVGAVEAAQQGRGIRFTESTTQEYQLVLPHLPSGMTVSKTVFLHGDLKARPYRVEHFRDALVRVQLMPEVLALGAYQMNHVWAITFKDEDAKKKILSLEAFSVKEHRCVVIDPCKQDVRMKLHWLLHTTPDDEVRMALAPFGKVIEISKEKWRVSGCYEKGSHTRLVSLRLKSGLTVEDLPHQLRIGEDNALVFVSGRAPLCLRCHGTGHIRRECRVPRCGACRRYGHEESQCVRSYANVTGTGGSDIVQEHLMDQADAEEASVGSGHQASRQENPPLASSEKDKEVRTEDENRQPAHPTTPESTPEMETNLGGGASASQNDSENEALPKSEKGSQPATAITKRPHEKVASDEDCSDPTSAVGPPPLKSTTTRRSSFKPKPTVPPDRLQGPRVPPR
ncbi:uncharacterized protein [Dermacentor andersoni]|uniref:uncharacterized protein n=1 Tax=Dermacentor andersoni TaxID=34620 RepID=UPI003B3AEC3F